MKVVKWGVHGTGTCIGPGILLMQKPEKFLYLALLAPSSGPWRVGSGWPNSQSGRVASGWKYEQPDSGRVENVSNPTRSRFGSKMSTRNPTRRSVYDFVASLNSLDICLTSGWKYSGIFQPDVKSRICGTYANYKVQPDANPPRTATRLRIFEPYAI